jgi:hypothetical protein
MATILSAHTLPLDEQAAILRERIRAQGLFRANDPKVLRLKEELADIEKLISDGAQLEPLKGWLTKNL